MADFVEAPFSDEQIQLLNEFQTGTGKSFPGHPFTCRDRGDGRHGDEGGDTGVLIATPDGWVCPHCDYTQAWAHAGMATRPSIPHESLLAEFFARGMDNPDRIDRILARYLQLWRNKAKREQPRW